MLCHICPFFGYQHPCLFELKKGECKALHIESVREVFEIQRDYYNRTKGAIEEGQVEKMLIEREKD